MDLFSFQNTKETTSNRASQIVAGTPLAEILRPQNFNDFVGQDVARENSPIRKQIEAGRLSSLILWGPPGCGKTTFAEIISKTVKARHIQRNAIDTGAKELRSLGEEAEQLRQLHTQTTILFIDEIHRLNKSQQDVLLPYVEHGSLILIGATTENPSFEVNSALLSRSRLVVFQKLAVDALKTIAHRAFQFVGHKPEQIISEDALEILYAMANGDARRLLNLIENIIFQYEQNSQSPSWPCTIENLKDIVPQQPIYYNRNDAHYDCASAFIKSIRSSNADAALYYLARMLEGGEDPMFIARRLVILASEDVGNADPRALQIAIAGQQALHFVGMPEGAINLAQVTTYLATAPKSNRSYVGLKKAQQCVKETGNLEIPLAIRNAPTQMMKDLGYGADYKYAHNYDRGYVSIECLPQSIQQTKFYEPSEYGYEKHIRNYLEWLKQSAAQHNSK